MLEQLSVRQYALIDQLDLTFSGGFNVLSGETGAGKSILIGALGLLLGDKGDTTAVRSGCDQASVSAIVRLNDDPAVSAWLDERGIVPEEGRVLLRRVLRTNGRGTVSLQGMGVTLRELRDFSQLLIDVHGQHEHQSLLRSDTQRTMLDSFGNLLEDVREVAKAYRELSDLKQQLDLLNRDERERLRERDMLEYALQEIEAASLRPGEEEELEQRIAMLSQYEQLMSHLEASRSSSHRALERIREAQGELARAAGIDQTLHNENSRVESLLYELEDVVEVLRERMEGLQIQPGELDELQERLQAIHRLEKKYGQSIDDVLGYAEKARTGIDDIAGSDERREALAGEYRRLQDEYLQSCRDLSERRNETASQLSENITALLQQLGMPHGRFTAAVRPREDRLRESGMDDVIFLIAPNRGEEEKPVQEIASGGEISRVMLALKSVLARSDRIDTLIFDEIDAGIGGAVANTIGTHLRGLGSVRQVICITHLASIAARAQSHYVVDKTMQGERTVTTVREVTGEQRVSEVARMLAGDGDQQTALAHARELMTQL